MAKRSLLSRYLSYMSRHSGNVPSYFVTGRDEPRLQIREYENVLPIVTTRGKTMTLGEENVPVSVLQS